MDLSELLVKGSVPLLRSCSMVRSKVSRQIAKFAVTGLALTILLSWIYLGLLRYTALSPAAALVFATLVASCFGYAAHSKFTFRGHGNRNGLTWRFTRFLATNMTGFLLNLFFVTLMIDVAGLPEWTPTLAFLFITPAISFYLNRAWVFA